MTPDNACRLCAAVLVVTRTGCGPRDRSIRRLGGSFDNVRKRRPGHGCGWAGVDLVVRSLAWFAARLLSGSTTSFSLGSLNLPFARWIGSRALAAAGPRRWAVVDDVGPWLTAGDHGSLPHRARNGHGVDGCRPPNVLLDHYRIGAGGMQFHFYP